MLIAPSIASGYLVDFKKKGFNQPGSPLHEDISETFNGRKDLIRMFNLFRIKVGDRVFPNVVIGDDGWFFYTAEYSMEDYQHVDRLTTKRLEMLRANLDALNKKLLKKGTILIVVIAPDKQTIYPQYMPDEIPVFEGPSRLDQFVTYMQEKGETHVIDLRPVLKQASQTSQVYYKTDTHWNKLGAYYAYQEILSALSAYNSSIKARPLTDYKISYQNASFDVSRILGIDTVFKEEKVILKEISPLKVEKKNAPKILVYHDSFFGALKPLLKPHFRMSVVNYNKKGVKWNVSHTEQEKYDFVVIEVVERNFVLKLLSLFDSK